MADKLNISSKPNEPVPALAMNSWSMQHTGRSCTGFKFSLRDMSQVCVKDMNQCVLHVTLFVQIALRSTTHAYRQI